MKNLLTFILGPSAVPLRFRVRWFIRGMGSILVPISSEDFRREVDQCVEEQMNAKGQPRPDTEL